MAANGAAGVLAIADFGDALLAGGLLLALLFLAICIVWLALGVISVSARSVRKWWRTQPTTRNAPERQYGFPVIAQPVLPVDNAGDGPGRYRIVGVVRETETDIVMHLEAATLANAKVKAELKGVIVTEIMKA